MPTEQHGVRRTIAKLKDNREVISTWLTGERPRKFPARMTEGLAGDEAELSQLRLDARREIQSDVLGGSTR